MKETIRRRWFGWAGLLGALAFLTGCQTADPGTGLGDVITPARVEAVATWGAYLGGQALVADGRAAELGLALRALEAIEASGQLDLAAVAIVLRSAGLEVLNTPEGALMVTTALMFSDFFHDSMSPVTDGPHGQAVVRGLVTGFRLALNSNQTRSMSLGGGVAPWLQREAEAQR